MQYRKKRVNGQKASDNELVIAYNELGNVWKVANRFGMGGQTVHQRLKKLGIELNNPGFREDERVLLKELYETGFKRGDGQLKALARELGRTVPFLSRKARELGLTTYSRELTEEMKDECSIRAKNYIKNNGHPKGMKGKTHTEETKKVISKISKDRAADMTEEEWNKRAEKSFLTREKNGTLPSVRSNTSWKSQWRSIGGKKHFYRRL